MSSLYFSTKGDLSILALDEDKQNYKITKDLLLGTRHEESSTLPRYGWIMRAQIDMDFRYYTGRENSDIPYLK